MTWWLVVVARLTPGFFVAQFVQNYYYLIVYYIKGKNHVKV